MVDVILCKLNLQQKNSVLLLQTTIWKKLYLMKYTITYESNPTQNDTKVLWKGISEHATLKKGLEPGKAFAFFVKDEAGKIKGGCSGYLFYGCLYVDLLGLINYYVANIMVLN